MPATIAGCADTPLTRPTVAPMLEFLVLGPVDSVRIDSLPQFAAPFFFVVDQRRLGTGQGGGPTRGQIVRVNPYGLAANGYLPVYEDYHASNGLFPIQ